jgi:hypothetical protein
MHFCSYKLKLEPTLRYPLPLTPELVAERLASDALVHGFASHPSGSRVVSVGLQRDRDSHEEALNELLLAVEEVGYTFVEAEITKIADRALEMAFGGSVGGLGIGSRTETAEGAVLGTMAGWCIGLLVGANVKKVEIMYRVQWTSAGWRFARVPPRQAAALSARATA